MRFLMKEEVNTKRTNELLKQISLVANSAGSVFQKIRAIAKIRQDNRTNEVIQNRCGKVLDKLYNIRYGEKRDFISKGELDEDLGKDVFEKNGKKYITGPRGTFEISTKSEKELKKDGYGYHHTITKDDKKYDVYTKDSDALAIVKENKKELDLDEALGLKEDTDGLYAFGWDKYENPMTGEKNWHSGTGTDSLIRLDRRKSKHNLKSQAHNWAKQRGYRGYSIGRLASHDPDEKYAQQYVPLTKFEEGISGNMTVEEIAEKHKVPVKDIRKQLKIGIKVEKEHTDDENKAERIALDHLFEIPNYYDKLCSEEHCFEIIDEKYWPNEVKNLNKEQFIETLVKDYDFPQETAEKLASQLDDKQIYVGIEDHQGGNFGVGRQENELDWVITALEWSYDDDEIFAEYTDEDFLNVFKHGELIDWIQEMWDITIVPKEEVSEEDWEYINDLNRSWYGESLNESPESSQTNSNKAYGRIITLLDGDFAFFFDKEAEKLSDILTVNEREFNERGEKVYKIPKGRHKYTTIPAYKLDEYKDKVEIIDEPYLTNESLENLEFVDEKLIQGKSDATLKKNIATEVKAGKDPKQAYAIAKSIQDKHKNEKLKESFDEEITDHFTPEEQAEYGIDEEGWTEDGLEQYIHCEWCNDVVPLSDTRKELNLGHICKGCQDALYSRGEKAVYEESLSEGLPPKPLYLGDESDYESLDDDFDMFESIDEVSENELLIDDDIEELKAFAKDVDEYKNR